MVNSRLGSSFLSFLVDYGLFGLLTVVLAPVGAASVIASNVLARVASATFNYTLNRRYVFRSDEGVSTTAPRYAMLAASILAVNTLLLWLLDRDRVRRRADWIPALESLPPLAVGAAFSLAFVRAGMFDYLPATWMLCYGLANMAFRRNLPVGVYLVGLFYLGAGLACLLIPGTSFTDPRPVGFVFGIGEIIGGYALLQRDGPGGQS